MGITKDYIKENIVLLFAFTLLIIGLFTILPGTSNPHLLNYTDCINYRFNEFNFTFPANRWAMLIYERGDYNMTIIQTTTTTPIFMYNLNASSRCLLIGRVENMTDFIRLYNLEYHEIEVKRNKIVGVK